MNEWKYNDLKTALGVEAETKEGSGKSAPDGGVLASGISIDSRTITSDQIFLALPGERFDGHDFIGAALEHGVRVVIAEKLRIGEERRSEILEQGVILFLVYDSQRALGELSLYHRNRIGVRVVAVTGSNGKTSTKEMLLGIGQQLLGAEKVWATPGNLNNEIGLPLSILSATPEHELLILELGMNHPGEIGRLSKLSKPDLAIITSIAAAHIENFSSIEEIARAKLEIVTGMAPGSILYYPARATGLQLARSSVSRGRQILHIFSINDMGQVSADREGLHLVWNGIEIDNPNYYLEEMGDNLLVSIMAFLALGFEMGAVTGAAARVAPQTPRRFQVLHTPKKSLKPELIIDDSYNANQSSFCSAIEGVRRLLPEGRVGLVAGEMAELGSEAESSHRAVGLAAAENEFEFVAAAGGQMAEKLVAAYRENKPDGQTLQCEGVKQLQESAELQELMADCDAILIKGSRSSRMDIISDALKEQGYV